MGAVPEMRTATATRRGATAAVDGQLDVASAAEDETLLQFGIPRRAHVCLVFGRLFKTHPTFDRVALDILLADPDAVLVLIQERQEPVTQAVWMRLQTAAHDTANSTTTEPSQIDALMRRVLLLHHWNFVEVLHQAHVVLDTHPYGGCLTTLETLAAAVPIVTLPSPFLRGRFSAALIRQMKLNPKHEAWLVADSPAHMVANVLRILTQPAARRELRAAIAIGYPRVHRHQEVADDWAALLWGLHRQAKIDNCGLKVQQQ